MATGPGYPSSTNTFIPNWETSGKLVVGFSRNAKNFPMMKYVQLVESPKNQGFYLKLGTTEQGRIVNQNDYAWNPGNERPQQNEGLESFNFIPFITKRWDYGFNLDYDTEQQAAWDIAEQHAQIHATKAMVCRTNRVITALTLASNYQTSADPGMTADHTGSASSVSGGYFDTGTTSAPYLKIGLDKAAVAIMLDTMGVVMPSQLQIVMNPNTARLIAESAELRDYIKGSPAALNEILSGGSPNAQYGPGMPSTIYGYPIIVDPTVKVTTRKNVAGTATKQFAWPDQTVALVSRIGELEGKYGGPSFSTITIFWYKDEMTIERFDDSKNRRAEYHVTDCTSEQVTSPLSGYLFTAATSVAS